MSGTQQNRRYVLILDDDASIRDAVAQALGRALPFPVVAFADGQQALSHAEQHPPLLVVLDVDMLPMSGIDFARRLRQRYPTMKLVFLTGSRHQREELEAVGAQAVLHKPVSVRELLDTVRHQLGSDASGGADEQP